MSFRHLKGSPKKDGLRYRCNLPTSQRRKKRVSQFLNLVHPSSRIFVHICSFLSWWLMLACRVSWNRGPQNHPNSLIFNRETRGLRDPNFDSVLYMQSSKTIICVDHSTPLWEFIDTHHISFFSFHPDVGFRSLTHSIQNWVIFRFLMVRCYMFFFCEGKCGYIPSLFKSQFQFLLATLLNQRSTSCFWWGQSSFLFLLVKRQLLVNRQFLIN
jgi:hypothetical protein